MCLFYGKRKTWNGRGSAGWDLLAFAGVDVFSAIMYHQIHQTYITATFLSFYVFLSVYSVWSFFLSKQYFNDPFVKLDTVLPKSIFWQGMRGWKKGREHRINKHRRRKGVHFMTDGFQCVCVPASFGTSYNCYGFKQPRTCYSVAPQCSALDF